MTCAKVIKAKTAFTLNSLQSCHMARCQIADMNIITYTCTIRRIIVIAKDAKLFTNAYSCLSDIWHEVIGNTIWILTNHTALMSAYRVEIA